MLALNRTYGRFIGRRGDQEYRVLTAVLRFAKYLHGTTQYHFANLRAEILKSAPADCVKRKVAPRAVRETRICRH